MLLTGVDGESNRPRRAVLSCRSSFCMLAWACFSSATSFLSACNSHSVSDRLVPGWFANVNTESVVELRNVTNVVPYRVLPDKFTEARGPGPYPTAKLCKTVKVWALTFTGEPKAATSTDSRNELFVSSTTDWRKSLVLF